MAPGWPCRSIPSPHPPSRLRVFAPFAFTFHNASSPITGPQTALVVEFRARGAKEQRSARGARGGRKGRSRRS